MAILNRTPSQKRTIDLKGPDGNAYALLGLARSWAKQLGYSKEKTDALLADMKSGNYDHLITVFDQHFGEIADLVR